MFGLNTTELIVILIIALVVFGPNKLPLIGGAVGKSIREFKKSLSGDADTDEKNKKDDGNAAKEDKKDNEEK
ncbi:MAG TPA: twin-arginine translocase TatA/TatE family subunit [Candidatus Wallbacteria bacterium]|nr:MAG: Sec-independent protein translocase protein TatAd [bacterium ADurb.Bin243]HOD39760.1 twin-arginine translocase TatA/TatE family subunit [Candidatus Wallbacteria bacterium]HPG56336.1 twin-arginine translocase TatA/TatE family subunit [Candidatus Wallbacteria bacterium]